MKKNTAIQVIRQGWGKEYKFSFEDEHAIYFESDFEEVKIVIDSYHEFGFYSVYGRLKTEEDWNLWDDLTKENVQWYLEK